MSMKLLFAIVTVFASLASADEMGPNGDMFYAEASHFANACVNDICTAPYSIQTVYNQKTRQSTLNAQQIEAFKEIAYNQAQIWGDTILEGDYHAAGRTRLDLVKAVYKDNQLVGYKIRYSEKAWYTGECEFDGRSRETLKNCKLGRIFEESYVSTDLRTYFPNEAKLADFALDMN
ncbi:MAG: hypothetical protein ACM3MG_12905 [Bacillota bacterium]